MSSLADAAFAGRRPLGLPALLAAGILLAHLGLIAATFTDYGMTWDEAAQSRYGELVVEYFRSGLRDTRCNEYMDLRFYGPLFESVTAAVYQGFGLPKAETRHLASALTGLAAVAGVMRLAALLGGPWLPVLAGSALLLWPRFYGHAFNNSKDVPFAAAFVWTMWAIARYFTAGRKPKDALLAGLSMGVALAMRPGGVLVFGLLAAVAALLDAAAASAPAAHLRSGLAKLAAMFAGAWVVMVPPWPWAHQSPLAHPVEAIRRATQFPANTPQLFEGRYVTALDLPWYYLPKYLAITTPVGFLALCAAGAWLVLRRRAAPGDASSSRQVFLGRVVLAWLALPVAYVVVRRPPLYDEVRHFLFLIPAAALLVGLGLEWTIGVAARRAGRAAWLLPLLLLEPAAQLVTLHPYQTTYFNLLTWSSGGTLSARYETDYWLSSYKEAIEWLNRLGPPPRGKWRIAVAASDPQILCAKYYAAPHVEIISSEGLDGRAPLPADVDGYVSTTRWYLHRAFAEVPVARIVVRDGMVFTVVKLRGADEGVTPRN